MRKKKFKVGDVVMTAEIDRSCNMTNTVFGVGQILEIIEMDNSSVPYKVSGISTNGYMTCWWSVGCSLVKIGEL